MKRKHFKRWLIVAVFLFGSLAATAHSAPLFTMSHTLQLDETFRSTLIKDEGGASAYEQGSITVSSKVVGYWYKSFRAPENKFPLNAAVITLTLFLGTTAPYQNIILQGSHDYNSGVEVGSVSSASGVYAPLIGREFSLTYGSPSTTSYVTIYGNW